MLVPPSTISVCPVIYALMSEAKKSAALAMSSMQPAGKGWQRSQCTRNCSFSAGVGISFRNGTDKPLRFLLYKQRYIPHPDPAMQPYAVFGNTNDIEERIYDNMENVFVRDLLPVDERFDMNMHILSFAPGGCHPFVETHVQEHGAYLYEGEGLYLLNDDWVPVKAEDFIWMGAYCKQCCYGVGLTRLSYIYSKDCHRDAEI